MYKRIGVTAALLAEGAKGPEGAAVLMVLRVTPVRAAGDYRT
jgi:hypothetical protein